MKLYKILKMVGNRGVSVFPPETQVLPPVEQTAGEPMLDIIRKVVGKGYTEHEAYMAIQAWAYHAKYDLNQAAAGIRTFCDMCAREIQFKEVPPEPITWTIIIGVAVLAAVALGLYVWAVLDQEKNVTFGSHPWAYLMKYNERLWLGEILNVGSEQRGYYEQSISFDVPMSSHERGRARVGGRDWFWFWPGGIVLEGRRIVFYHFYQIFGFYVEFCGVLTRLSPTLLKLRDGGNDPFKPYGPWSRPGGRIFTPEYEGCWVEWWWL